MQQIHQKLSSKMLSEKHIKGFALYYFGCFFANFCWLFYNGLLPSMFQPVFTYLHADLTGLILLQSNLPKLFINYKWVPLSFDVLIFLLQFLLFYSTYTARKWTSLAVMSTLIINVVYYYLFSITGVISIEVFTAYMFVPLIFFPLTIDGKYYALQSVRFLFLLFFVSAAIWKLRTAAIFNTNQMSGILLKHHTDLLIIKPSDFYSNAILFLIDHPIISYCLYLFSFLIECSFLIGFFTRKYDHSLIVLFCLFIIFDYIILGISYFAWMPFLGCLYLSQYNIEEKKVPVPLTV